MERFGAQGLMHAPGIGKMIGTRRVTRRWHKRREMETKSQFVRVGDYLINLENIAYVYNPLPTLVEIIFASGVRLDLEGEDAQEFLRYA